MPYIKQEDRAIYDTIPMQPCIVQMSLGVGIWINERMRRGILMGM